jgi:hypothetical protein
VYDSGWPVLIFDGRVKDRPGRSRSPRRRCQPRSVILDEALATSERTGHCTFDAQLHRTCGEMRSESARILRPHDPLALFSCSFRVTEQGYPIQMAEAGQAEFYALLVLLVIKFLAAPNVLHLSAVRFLPSAALCISILTIPLPLVCSHLVHQLVTGISSC